MTPWTIGISVFRLPVLSRGKELIATLHRRMARIDPLSTFAILSPVPGLSPKIP
jgi:hypothetical protein